MAGINDTKIAERNYSVKWDNPAMYLNELMINKAKSDGCTEDKQYGTN